MKVFVFGIGGTGSRILRSLTMLLASGVEIPRDVKIIPVIIDLDIQNGDTVRTLKAMELYRNIRSKAYLNDYEEGFFNAELVTLAANNQNNTEGQIKDQFNLEFGDVNDTFFKYLEGGNMDSIDQDFLKLLYDDSPEDNPKTELNLRLTKGFKGNPNVGSVVFNDLINTPEYKYFLDVFTEGDRIFILSSIFGGTGSAGFPQLVENIRASNHNYIRDSVIGAVPVAPYFNIKEDSNSAIDSKNFISKTKAALSYYENTMDGKVNDIYYIGDSPGDDAYENNEGGEEQTNKAHVIELLASLSVIHFINKENNDFQPGITNYYEFGIKEEASRLTFPNFYEKTNKKYFHNLTYLSLFYKLWSMHIPQNIEKDFVQELDLKKRKDEDPFFKNMDEFLSNHFYKWMKELGENSRGFLPFNLDSTFNKIIFNKTIKGLDKSFGRDFFTSAMTKSQRELMKKEIDAPEEQFLRMTWESCVSAFNKRIEVLPS